MSLGHIAHVSKMMPYWLVFLLAWVKPQCTLFLLGPPKVVTYIPIEERRNTQRGLLDVAKAEAGAVLTSIMFISSAALDVKHVYESATMPNATLQDRFGEVFSSLAVSPNIGTQMCLLALVSIYSPTKFDASPYEALMGKEWAVTKQVYEFRNGSGRIVSVLMLPLVTIMFLLQLAAGGIFEQLDREAVHYMPSFVQRILVKTSFHTYKILYHLLLIVALPGIFAYLYLPTFILLTSSKLARVVAKYVLPWTLRMRKYIGASQHDIDASILHTLHHPFEWDIYILAPSFFAFIVPMMVPLSLRLVGGAGYSNALIETWSDRHISVYIDTLFSKVQHGADSVRGIVIQMWVNLVAMFL